MSKYHTQVSEFLTLTSHDFSTPILEYLPSKIDRSTLENWVDTVRAHIKMLNTGDTYKAIHNLSNEGVAIAYATIYKNRILNVGVMPEHEQDILDHLAENQISAKCVILLSKKFSGKLAEVMASVELKNKRSPVEYRVFHELDEALDWIKSDGQST